MYRQSAETALFLQKATGPSSSYAQGSQQDYVGMTTTPQTPTVADRAYQAQQQLQTSQGGADHEFANSALQSPPLPPPTSSARASVGSDGDMPPYDLLYSLVDLYFKHINQWCPILHRKATLEALFGASAGVGEPRSAEDTETDRILLHAIVATTLRYSNDPRLTEERKQHYYSVAKSKVLLYGMENSSVKALQALVILALDLLGSGHGPPGWNIMALLVRSVVQLGLSVETTSFSVSPNYQSIYTLREMILPEPKDFIEEESRRRLFWMVYLLDRYATIATAFEFALDDREIDRLLPCRDDLWMKNQKVETRWFKAGSDYYLPPFSPPAGDTPGTAPGTFGDAAPGTGGRPSPEHADVSGQGGAAGAAGACRQSVSGASAVSISVSGPGPGSGPGSAENLGAFSYYIEILGILSKIHQFLKQPVNISAPQDVDQWQRRYKELDATLTNWKYSLPADYGNMGRLFQPGSAKQLSAGWIMLHATYHTAIIRLHSSAAYPTTRSHIFTPSYSASQRCHSAVENIATLGEWVVNNNMMPRLGPPFAFTLWVSARLLLVHGSTVEGKLSPQIPLLVDWLKAMGQWWPVARRYAGLLTRVLDEHAEAQGRGDGVVPGSVKILADMRRTAFDLELLMTRTPRHGHGHYVHGSSGSGDGHNQHGHQHQSHGVQSHQPGSSGGSQHTSAPAQAGHQQHHYMPGFGQSTATTNGHAWNGQVTATTTAATDSTAQGQWQGASDGNAGDSANNGGSSAAAGASINRLASTTPALNPAIQAVRTPAPNELEYLDVFDFFNYPRLPQGMVNLAAGGGVMHGGLSGHQHAVEMDTSGDGAAGGSNGGGLMVTGTGPGGISVVMPDGFNITNFMPDASSDWLFKHDGGKFMA